MIRLENTLKISLQEVLKTSWRCLKTLLQDVLKTSWQEVLKISWRRLEDVLKMSEDVYARRLEDVWSRRIYWSWPRSLEDFFRRRMTKANVFALTKTSWRRRQNTSSRRLWNVFKTSLSRPMFGGKCVNKWFLMFKVTIKWKKLMLREALLPKKNSYCGNILSSTFLRSEILRRDT